MARSFVVTLAAGMFAAVAPAQAGTTPDWLTWETGSTAQGCPDAEAFGVLVEQRLAGSLPVASPSGRRVFARIVRENDDDPLWLAEVRLLTSSGAQLASRTLSLYQETCGPVANALALVTALVLTNQAAGEKKLAIAARPLPTPPEKPPEPWALAAEVDAIASAGLLGGPRPAGQFGLALQGPSWLGVSAAWARWGETDRRIDDATGARLRFWRASLDASARIWRRASFATGAAAGMGWGRMSATGTGFPTEVSSARWLYDLHGGAWMRQQLLGGLYLGIQASLLVPLVRARVTYSASGVSHELLVHDRVAVLGCLGLGFALPL